MCLENRVAAVDQEYHQRAEREPRTGYILKPRSLGYRIYTGGHGWGQWEPLEHLRVSVMSWGYREGSHLRYNIFNKFLAASFPYSVRKRWAMDLDSRPEEQVSDVGGRNRKWNSAGQLREPRSKKRHHSPHGSLESRVFSHTVSSLHWLQAGDNRPSKQ